MTVLQKEKITDKYIMEKPDFFSLDRTLDCGQCFRFEKKRRYLAGGGLGTGDQDKGK